MNIKYIIIVNDGFNFSFIQLIVSQLTLIGQETDCVAECDQIVQDQ